VFLVVDLTLACWALLEVFLRVRDLVTGRGRSDRDRATRILIGVAVGLAIAVAAAGTSGRVRAGYGIAGAIVMWTGLGVRVWAIAALGSAFRTTVEVDPDQPVVSSGPYGWVRHPSYTGLLLVLAGFGLARGTWPALAVCLVVPLAAIVRRIQVEEAELSHVLGERYCAYQARTKRLIPGLW
jgi:protein-S-isoprenylcysteine O-methyltransferase Ste14